MTTTTKTYRAHISVLSDGTLNIAVYPQVDGSVNALVASAAIRNITGDQCDAHRVHLALQAMGLALTWEDALTLPQWLPVGTVLQGDVTVAMR